MPRLARGLFRFGAPQVAAADASRSCRRVEALVSRLFRSGFSFMSPSRSSLCGTEQATCSVRSHGDFLIIGIGDIGIGDR